MTRLAYVLAASHSGSTLLTMLLGSHPQIATAGEMKLSSRAMGDLSRYRCSCGSLIGECVFWRKVNEGMARRGFSFDLACAGTDYRTIESRYARRLLGILHRGRLLESLRDGALGLSATWRRQLPEIHRRNAALAATVAEVRKAEVVVDSSKIGLRLKYLLRNPELEVTVIRLIRDGRAVALTYMDPAQFADAQNPSMRAGGMGGDRKGECLSMGQAAERWKRCNEEAENIVAQLASTQYIEVRYEQLCTNPATTLRRVLSFLRVNPSLTVENFRSVEQHIVGNGMRLDTSSEIRLDERWRSALSAEELGVFERVAGEMNLRYGYK